VRTPPRPSARTATVLLIVAGLVVVATPFDSTVNLGIPFLRNPAAVLGVLLAVLFLWASRGRLVISSPSQLWAIGFMGVVGVQELLRLVLADALPFVGTPSLSTVAVRYMSWIQPVILFLLVSLIAKDRRSVAFVLVGVPLVMAALAVGSLSAVGSGRWAPVGLNENFAGLAFGMSLVIATAWLLRPSLGAAPLLTAAFVASVPLNLIGLLVTGSRGASASAAVALGLLFLLSSIKLRRMLVLVSALMVMALVSGNYLQRASDVLLTRWERAVEGTSLGARDQLIFISLELLVESPAWGYGLQANHAIGERWRGERGMDGNAPISPHNTFLALLVSFGVVGAAPWFAMFASVGVRSWTHRRTPEGALLVSLLALFSIYMVFGNISGDKLLHATLGLAACLPNWRD
jgi:hypothetical protein